MWEANVGEELTCYRENGNRIDPFAVARVTDPVFRRLGPIRSQREGLLVIEDPVNRGHCQRGAVTQVQLRRAVQCT